MKESFCQSTFTLALSKHVDKKKRKKEQNQRNNKYLRGRPATTVTHSHRGRTVTWPDMARHQRSSKQTVAITVYQHQHGRYGSWWMATGVWCPCGRRSGSAETVVTGGKLTDWCGGGGGICVVFFSTTWWQKLECNFRQWSLHDGEAKRRPTLATTFAEVKLQRLKHTEIKTSAAKPLQAANVTPPKPSVAVGSSTAVGHDAAAAPVSPMLPGWL